MGWIKDKTKYSEKYDPLTRYERFFTKFSICPHCNSKSITYRYSTNSDLVKLNYHACYLCGFTFTISNAVILEACKIYINFGFEQKYIDVIKSRRNKIKRIRKKQKKHANI